MGIETREHSRQDVEVECQYEKKYEAYSWCDLSDNPCYKDTGDCEEWNELLPVVVCPDCDNRFHAIAKTPICPKCLLHIGYKQSNKGGC